MLSKWSLLTIFCLGLAANAMASSLGISQLHGGASGIDYDTGYREQVDLASTGGVLSAGSGLDYLEKLIITAPNTHEGNVIIRELKLDNGDISLLMTAPPALTEDVVRVSLYFSAMPRRYVLYRDKTKHWQKATSIPLKLEPRTNSGAPQASQLYAVILPVLPNLRFSMSLPGNTDNSAGSLQTELQGDAFTGISTWVYAILALAIFWGVSVWAHKRQLIKSM